MCTGEEGREVEGGGRGERGGGKERGVGESEEGREGGKIKITYCTFQLCVQGRCSTKHFQFQHECDKILSLLLGYLSASGYQATEA